MEDHSSDCLSEAKELDTGSNKETNSLSSNIAEKEEEEEEEERSNDIDDTMDTNYYDAWENDAYSNDSGSSDLFLLPQTLRSKVIDDSEVVEILDDNLEENNNDPNNNMDSIEINEILMDTNDQPLRPTMLEQFPKPGCSKDLSPILIDRDDTARAEKPSNKSTINEKVEYILNLVAKVNHVSVRKALLNNDKVSIDQLKLWDLLPHGESLDYLSLARNSVTPIKLIRDYPDMEWMTAPSTSTSGNSKRGPQEDICTVEPKKSSSIPDLSDIVPVAEVSESSPILSGNVDATVSRGAIPKVRYISGKEQSTVPSKDRKSPPIMVLPTPKIQNRFEDNRGMLSNLATEMVAQIRADKKTEARRVSHAAIALPSQSPVKATNIIQPSRITYATSKPLQTVTNVKAPFLKYPIVAAKHPESRGAIPRVIVDPQRKKAVAPVKKPDVVEPPAARALPLNTVAVQPVLCSSSAGASIIKAPKLQLPEQQQRIIQKEQLPQPKITPQQHQQQRQNTERPVCMEMYYKLIVIFPNVDPEYVKNLCPPEWGPGDHEAQLAPIIDHLLTRGDSVPRAPIKIINDANVDNVDSVDGIYEFLLGIFPDADPHYLREFAVANVGKSDAVKNFVDSKLQHRNYPTREEYKARLKITEQQRQYTTNFSVKQFISIIPDPSKHFMDPKRKCIHNTVASEFLKSYFNKHRVHTISRIYTECNYNLSQTASKLENYTPDMMSKRGGREIPTEDILLLQEIAYIKHRAEINQYIANTERVEREEFNSLKAMNQLLVCQCCYDEECVPSKCSTCDNGHIFCKSCIITGTTTKMAEDDTRIYCFVNCGSEFSLSVLQEVIPPTTFSILLKKRQAAEVIQAGLEGLVSCPFCHFASIPPEGDKIFKCLNPECTKESCRLCKELSHVPFKCGENEKADKARRYIEEKMTEALARKCYNCQKAYFKEDGCNKITCPCGAKMCYLCDQPIKDYTHFRGQGSNDIKLCPLWTDSIRLDSVAVRKVGEQAQKDMIRLNPNVKIDASNLLPEIAQARNGPHNDIVNADELPRRAQRVLDIPMV